MVAVDYKFNPDYTVAPGSVLKERLEVQGMSQAEFARRCGRSAKLVSEIIAGKARIEPQTALQFEKVLGVDASIWIGLDSIYQITEHERLKKRKQLQIWSGRKPFQFRNSWKENAFRIRFQILTQY